MQQVSLRDVAAATGTSISTVSLALRGSTRISQATRERVKEAADRLGYKADMAGSLLRTKSPRIIGLICSLTQELHLSYYHHIHRLAAERGYEVLVEDASMSESFDQCVQALRSFRAQSLIVVDPFPKASLAQVDIPVTVIGQYSPFPDADLITSDNTSGMSQAVSLLAKQGIDQIVYLDGPAGHSADARESALLEAAQRQNVTVEVIPAGATLNKGFLAMSQLIREHNLPQALICYNDLCAQGALVALFKSGISVPQQVKVVGFDNSRTAASDAFHITSVDRNELAVARLAVDASLSRIANPQAPARSLRVETDLVRRATA